MGNAATMNGSSIMSTGVYNLKYKKLAYSLASGVWIHGSFIHKPCEEDDKSLSRGLSNSDEANWSRAGRETKDGDVTK